jgi:hypothetical protein
MKVIRYSVAAFEPQEQTHHTEHIQYHLCGGFNINDFPELMRWQIQKIHEQKVAFYKEHLEDFKSGIWCFVDGHKDNQSLNHLKRKVPCWEAEVPDDIECFDCNWEKLTTISDPCVLCGGCYIPERELYKIKNIRIRRKTA